jgi:hypothetical protein
VRGPSSCRSMSSGPDQLGILAAKSPRREWVERARAKNEGPTAMGGWVIGSAAPGGVSYRVAHHGARQGWGRVADERLTIREAAARLRVSESAIRKRIDRETLRHDKGPDGRIYVYVDTVADDVADMSTTRARDALISEMRGRIEDLRSQLESERQGHAEARRLLAAALERIPPQIEAPSEPPQWPETPTEEPDRGEPRDQDRGGRLPWWRRLF